jgi:hypothetical protein
MQTHDAGRSPLFKAADYSAAAASMLPMVGRLAESSGRSGAMLRCVDGLAPAL